MITRYGFDVCIRARLQLFFTDCLDVPSFAAVCVEDIQICLEDSTMVSILPPKPPEDAEDWDALLPSSPFIGSYL